MTQFDPRPRYRLFPAIVLAGLRGDSLRTILCPGEGQSDGGIHADIDRSVVPTALRIPNSTLWLIMDDRGVVRFASHRDAIRREELFQGIYVVHWEVLRFVCVSGTRLLGLLQRVQRYSPRFRAGALESVGIPEPSLDGPTRFYRMTVAGNLGPPGEFGHKGICTHELFVSVVVESTEVHDPPSTW